MHFKEETKSGTMTIELILSLLSIILIMFVAFDSFSNNLNKMVSNSNFKLITEKNSAKTAYTDYNRDYTNSTIYVK